MEKGASDWLTALPVKRYGFTNEVQFRDRLCIRYNIEAKNTAINCPCGQNFTLQNALYYAKSGYRYEIRDNFAKIIYDVCFFEVEPTLQLLHGKSFIHKTTSTDEKAQIDIKANGLWGQGSAVISSI